MQNAILKICERLRGYTDDEYFEVLYIEKQSEDIYNVQIQAVKRQDKGGNNESNE